MAKATAKQLAGLNVAAARLAKGTASAADKTNLAYAQKNLGYTLPKAQTTTPPVTPAPAVQPAGEPLPQNNVQPLQSFDEWLKTGGAPFAAMMDLNTIQQQNAPYYNYQTAAENWAQGIAQQNLQRNIQNTTQNTGNAFNSRGIYGSGMYQQELGKQLDTLNTNFDNTWGTGPYTSYSQRLQNIQQQQQQTNANQQLDAATRAQNAFYGQYGPTILAANQAQPKQ